MTTCVDRLAPAERILCNSNHCDGFQETSDFHAICNCVDWQGNPIPNCSVKDNLYPVQTGQCIDKSGNYVAKNAHDCFVAGFEWETCYCCCSCFAAYTPVGVPGGMRKIGDIAIGDQVLAAAKQGTSWAWTPQQVQFSSGSPADFRSGAGNLMLYIEYGDAKWLVATSNQLFLVMASGKLKRADQLIPGVDQLVSGEGAGVAIARIHSGNFQGGVHHIATAVVSYEDFTGSIDNHLINANGIISGDYLLQIFQDTDKMKPNMADPKAPSVGTPAYKSKNAGVHVQPYVAAVSPAMAGAAVRALDFAPYGDSQTHIPDDAASLFTRTQEAQLIGPSVRPFSDTTNKDMVTYYAELYAAFYPEVRFYLDWESLRPNVFAFEEFGQKTVVIGGELLRLGPLYDGAMAVVLAFGVGSLLGGPPTDSETGYTSAGQALYFGMGVVMRTALRGGTNWMNTAVAGQGQLNQVITPLVSNPQAGSESDRPSLQCLMDVMNAVISGMELPACAGGPTEGGLKVDSASYDAQAQQATVTYNEAVSAYSATNPRNYSVTPGPVAITAATVDPNDPACVILTVALAPGDYTVAASNVRASDGSTLDPNTSSATFTVKKK